MMKKISQWIQENYTELNFNAIGIGRVDFQHKSFEVLNYRIENDKLINCDDSYYFDLASLTKPLTNSLMFLEDEKTFSKDEILLLEHRADIPAWGILSKDDWQNQILSYPIKESEVLYSDFSCLRLMIEWERKNKKTIYQECQKYWDKNFKYWLDLKLKDKTYPTGYRKGRLIHREVHDPNAYNLNSFCTHAGLFSTVSGLSQTLLNCESKLKMIDRLKDVDKYSHRFYRGFDRVLDPSNSLAGSGCSLKTIGHLGFTGTSFWIDLEKKIGSIILTNSTIAGWYEKAPLNLLRKEVGHLIWNY